MSRKNVMREWEDSWSQFEKRRSIGEFFMDNAHKIVFGMIEKTSLNNPRIVDIGCGTGTTLLKIRKKGYQNAIGIDHSVSSIDICRKAGFVENKDVFLEDAFNTGFRPGSFDIVFSEGLLEHFIDFDSLVKEMCRISRRYVLLIQPNHFSPFKMLAGAYYFLFPNPSTVKEYTYRIEDFRSAFRRYGFELEDVRVSLMGAFWVLLFRKS